MDINDKYIMEFKLGEGGFAKVYQAQCRHTDTAKAIKVIRVAMKKLAGKVPQYRCCGSAGIRASSSSKTCPRKANSVME